MTADKDVRFCQQRMAVKCLQSVAACLCHQELANCDGRIVLTAPV